MNIVADRLLGGRYRITETIGTGGMAEVYRAFDETLGRTVAVKVMHPQFAADATFAARFKQEAQAAAQLKSERIVTVYDWGQDDDTYFMVMELVEGEDLKSRIERVGPLPFADVAAIGAQVAEALAVAHERGILHRDVTSRNVLLTADGNAKIADFGIARLGNAVMTQTGSVLGSAHYFSPEQAQGLALSAATDLYSLGVVLFEAVTGQLPFEAETPVAVALKQVHEAPPAPHDQRPDVDAGLENVIVKAMSKRPEERHSSAAEMRRELLAIATRLGAGETAALPAVMPEGAADGTAVLAETSDQQRATSVLPTASARAAPDRGRPHRLMWPIVVAVLLLAAVAVWAAGTIAGEVSVPDVAGMSVAEAEATFSEAGLDVGEVSEVHDAAPPGTIIGQSPGPGESARRGSAVALTASLGPRPVEVPNVEGLTEQEARTAIESAGLVPAEPQREYSAQVGGGRVIRQSPAPGEMLAEGGTVSYVLSAGAAPRDDDDSGRDKENPGRGSEPPGKDDKDDKDKDD